jgi:hypothetical protein
MYTYTVVLTWERDWGVHVCICSFHVYMCGCPSPVVALMRVFMFELLFVLVLYNTIREKWETCEKGNYFTSFCFTSDRG